MSNLRVGKMRHAEHMNYKCHFKSSIDLMQMICVNKLVVEKSLDDSIQETALIHHYFGCSHRY